MAEDDDRDGLSGETVRVLRLNLCKSLQRHYLEASSRLCVVSYAPGIQYGLDNVPDNNILLD